MEEDKAGQEGEYCVCRSRVGACTPVWTRVWRSENNLKVSLLGASHFFLRQGLLLACNFVKSAKWLSASFQVSTCPCLPPLHHSLPPPLQRPRFVHGFWGCKLRSSCLQGSTLPWLISWLVSEGLTKESTVRINPWRGEIEQCRYFGTEHSRKKAQCRLRVSAFRACFE